MKNQSRDRLTEREQADSCWWGGFGAGWVMERLNKKEKQEKKLTDMDNSVVTA